MRKQCYWYGYPDADCEGLDEYTFTVLMVLGTVFMNGWGYFFWLTICCYIVETIEEIKRNSNTSQPIRAPTEKNRVVADVESQLPQNNEAVDATTTAKLNQADNVVVVEMKDAPV